MTHTKKLLLASVAAFVLALPVASPASAFDDTDWVWLVNVDKDIDENVDIEIDLDPTGMVTVENLQENIGDVTSTATMNNINHTPPGFDEGGTVNIEETVTVTSNFNKPIGVGNSVQDTGGNVNDDGDSPLNVTYDGGTLGEQANGYTVINDINISGSFDVDSVEGVNNALDLPKVENRATSVANNTSLDSDVAVNVSNGQFNFGGFNGEASDLSGAELSVLGFAADSSDNSNHNLANVGAVAGALGIITQGEVSAAATIDGSLNDNDINEEGIAIQQASVENAATAVGNNFSVDLEAMTSGDAFLVADSTQFNYANTTSTALVDGISIENYSGLGAAGFGPALDGLGTQTPIVSNVATSIGNNASISVSTPDLGL